MFLHGVDRNNFTFYFFSLFVKFLWAFASFLFYFFLPIQWFLNSAMTKPKLWIHLLILSSRYILDRISIICTSITTIGTFCHTLYSVLTWWNSCFLLLYSAHFYSLSQPLSSFFPALQSYPSSYWSSSWRRRWGWMKGGLENYKTGSKIGKLPYTAPSPCILCTL